MTRRKILVYHPKSMIMHLIPQLFQVALNLDFKDYLLIIHVKIILYDILDLLLDLVEHGPDNFAH